MTRLLGMLIVAAALAGTASAHHSYAAYDNARLLTIDGTLESFEMINPHSLVTVRGEQGVSVFEWRAPNGLLRMGVHKGFFTPGDRVILSGNPHREYAENRIVNLKKLCRPSDGWAFPAGTGCD